MVLSVGNDQQFAKFCQIIGRQDMAKDRLYAKIVQGLKTATSGPSACNLFGCPSPYLVA